MKEIFVFGSNLAGRHGKGAAKFAKDNYGAIYGRGKGIQGNSYAIPTKDAYLEPLPLKSIDNFVHEILCYAQDNPQDTFNVTRIGCGLAGYNDNQIAPMFKGAPENCKLPTGWR
mgnify:CR=1 FL=1